MSRSLDGDDFLPNIYHYLWNRKVTLIESPLRAVRIPSTVVYESNFPKAWYYYSVKKEEIQRKVGKDIDARSVLHAFSQQGCDISACFKTMVGGKVEVEFMDEAGLVDFLMKRERRGTGILQKFVQPQGDHNAVIQVTWTPKITFVGKRQNVHELSDRRWGLAERAVTYENGSEHCTRSGFVAPHVEYQVRDACRLFTEHLLETESLTLLSALLYFKACPSGLYILYGRSIRVSDKQKEIPITAPTAPTRKRRWRSPSSAPRVYRESLSASLSSGLALSSAASSPVFPRPPPSRTHIARYVRLNASLVLSALAPDGTASPASTEGTFKMPGITFHAKQRHSTRPSIHPQARLPTVAQGEAATASPPLGKVLWARVRDLLKSPQVRRSVRLLDELEQAAETVSYQQYSHFLSPQQTQPFQFALQPLVHTLFGGVLVALLETDYGLRPQGGQALPHAYVLHRRVPHVQFALWADQARIAVQSPIAELPSIWEPYRTKIQNYVATGRLVADRYLR